MQNDCDFIILEGLQLFLVKTKHHFELLKQRSKADFKRNINSDFRLLTLKIVIYNDVERKSRRLFETRLQVCGKVFTLNILHHNCRSKNFCSCSLYTGNASNQPLESVTPGKGYENVIAGEREGEPGGCLWCYNINASGEYENITPYFYLQEIRYSRSYRREELRIEGSLHSKTSRHTFSFYRSNTLIKDILDVRSSQRFMSLKVVALLSAEIENPKLGTVQQGQFVLNSCSKYVSAEGSTQEKVADA
uniref:Uncharacterized protein n=1 Tax=Glossina pallidipes TaxID=7398 RepID=A0A1A9ZXW3_GLOPL